MLSVLGLPLISPLRPKRKPQLVKQQGWAETYRGRALEVREGYGYCKLASCFLCLVTVYNGPLLPIVYGVR